MLLAWSSSFRRYKCKRDFEAALGMAEVEHLPDQRVAVFFFCELASLHSALQEAANYAMLSYTVRSYTVPHSTLLYSTLL